MELREYQKKAVEHVLSQWEKNESVLLHLATGTGKTIIFSEICRRLAEKNKRVCVVMHLHTLVQQTVKKISYFWDKEIGIICASASKTKTAKNKITVASIQSILPFLEKNPSCYFDYCIIDEGHHIPPKNVVSQYGTMLTLLKSRCQNFRMLGVTATPFRMKQGSIAGQENSWFSKISFSYGVKEAQRDGYLCMYQHLLPIDIRKDLNEIPVNNGEYKRVPLSKLMRSAANLQSVIVALRGHTQERKHIGVFAVDIEHAEALTKKLNENGIRADCVHSKKNASDVASIFKNFSDGTIQALVSVDMLTEGFDFPAMDCLVITQPTKSLARHLQILGRGLRIADGKKDCLILDLAGNAFFHGSARNPYCPEKGEKNPINVACPRCKTLNGVIPGEKTTYFCRKCGYRLYEVMSRGKNENGNIKILNEKICPMLPYLESNRIEEALQKQKEFLCLNASYENKTGMFGKYITVSLYLEYDAHVFAAFLNLNPEGMRDYFLLIWRFWGKGDPPNTIKECTRAIKKGFLVVPAYVEVEYSRKGLLRPKFTTKGCSFVERGLSDGSIIQHETSTYTPSFIRKNI